MCFWLIGKLWYAVSGQKRAHWMRFSLNLKKCWWMRWCWTRIFAMFNSSRSPDKWINAMHTNHTNTNRRKAAKQWSPKICLLFCSTNKSFVVGNSQRLLCGSVSVKIWNGNNVYNVKCWLKSGSQNKMCQKQMWHFIQCNTTHTHIHTHLLFIHIQIYKK